MRLRPMRGVRPLVFWVSLARLQYGVLPLALVLLIVQGGGSYAEAGAAAAAYGIAAGLLGPARSRLIDRGPRGVVVLLAMASGLALTGLVALVAPTGAARQPSAVVLLVALVAGGCPPPVGPLMRAAWRRRLGEDEDRLRRAYSFDAVSEEILYVLGPLIAATAAARLGAGRVLIGSSAALVIAAAGIATCWTTPARPAGSPDGTPAPTSPRPPIPLWRDTTFLVGLGPVTALGFLLGGVDIAALAAAVRAAGASAAGGPAAAIAAGSVVGGLAFGRWRLAGRPAEQVRVLVLSAAGLVALAALATSQFVLLVAVLAVAGLAIAPALVCSYLVADASAPIGSTEATSWVTSAFNVSLAFGTAVAGRLVDGASPWLALLAIAGAAAVVVLAVPRPAPARRPDRTASTGTADVG